MKEVLIYGSLIAAVLGTSSIMINSLNNNLTNKTTEINQAIDQNINALVGVSSQTNN